MYCRTICNRPAHFIEWYWMVSLNAASALAAPSGSTPIILTRGFLILQPLRYRNNTAAPNRNKQYICIRSSSRTSNAIVPLPFNYILIIERDGRTHNHVLVGVPSLFGKLHHRFHRSTTSAPYCFVALTFIKRRMFWHNNSRFNARRFAARATPCA